MPRKCCRIGVQFSDVSKQSYQQQELSATIRLPPSKWQSADIHRRLEEGTDINTRHAIPVSRPDKKRTSGVKQRYSTGNAFITPKQQDRDKLEL